MKRYTFIHFTVDHREIDEITHVTQEDNLPQVSKWFRMGEEINPNMSSIPGTMNKAHSVWFDQMPDGSYENEEQYPPRFGKGIAVFANQPQP